MTEFSKMTVEEQRAHVEKSEQQVNDLVKYFMKYVDEHDVDANIMAAALMGMLGRMITSTVGDDVALQDAYLATVLKGITISMAENGHRNFDAGTKIPPWMKN